MKVDLRSPHSIIDKFVSLLAISHRINSEKDFDELLNIITAEAAKLVDAERATIFVLDKATGQLWARTALGMSDRYVPAAQLTRSPWHPAYVTR